MSRGQLASAVAIGYVLGRGRRMRWALALGTAAAAGRLSAARGGPASWLGSLGASPGLSRLREAGRPLVAAGGAAARTAVGGRIDTAADRLQQTAQRLRGTGGSGAGDPDTAGRARDADERDIDERDIEERDAQEPDDDERYADADGYEDEDSYDEDADDYDDDSDGDGGRERPVEKPRPVEQARPPVRRRGR